MKVTISLLLAALMGVASIGAAYANCGPGKTFRCYYDSHGQKRCGCM